MIHDWMLKKPLYPTPKTAPPIQPPMRAPITPSTRVASQPPP